MTDAEFRAWLTRDNEHRVVLARMSYQYESGGAPATGILYFSNLPYIDEDGDPDPIAYLSAIKSTPQYSRSLSGERLGGYSSSVGALELDNADGALDYMLALPIDGSEITFLCGGIDWPIADFRSMFVALTVKIIAAAWDRITVTLRDTSLLLDKSVGGESSIDDGSPAVDNWRAANFGLLHQLECKLVDQSTLTYAHSDTGDGIAYSPDFEQTVRDRGYPILYTDNGDGTISLDVTPDGEITTDLLMVEGTNPPGYRAVSDAMQWLVGTRCGLTALGKYYGPDDTYDLRPNTDIGAWSLDGGQDYLIGISIQNKTNVEQLLNDLCDTGICFRAIRRDGMFTFGRIRPNDIASLGVASQATIREDDLDDNIRIEHATPTYYRLQAQMNTNWRIISNPATALLPEELAILTRDGLTQIQADAIGVTYADKPELYNLTLVQSPLIETLLSGDDEFYDAEYLVQWMEVRRSTFLPWMETVTVTVGLEYFELELGNVVTLEVPRFDFDAGELTQVIGIDINLMNAKITLRLMHRRLAAPPPEGWVREVEDADNIAGFSLQVPRPLIPIVELDLVFPGVVGGIGVGLLPIVTPYGAAPPMVCGTGFQFSGATTLNALVDSSVLILPAPDMLNLPVDSGDVSWVITDYAPLAFANPTVTAVSAFSVDGWLFNGFPETDGAYSGGLWSLQAVVDGNNVCSGISIGAGGWYFDNIGTEIPGVFDPIAEVFSQFILLDGTTLSGLTSDIQWVITQTAGSMVALPNVYSVSGNVVDGFKIDTAAAGVTSDSITAYADADGEFIGSAFSLQAQEGTEHDIDGIPTVWTDIYAPVLIRASSIFFDYGSLSSINNLAAAAGHPLPHGTPYGDTIVAYNTYPYQHGHRIRFDAYKTLDDTPDPGVQTGYMGVWGGVIIVRGDDPPPPPLVTWSYTVNWQGNPDTDTHLNDVAVTSDGGLFQFEVTPNWSLASDDPGGPYCYITGLGITATHVNGAAYDVYPVNNAGMTMGYL